MRQNGAACSPFNEFGLGTVVLKPTPWGIVPKGEWTDHEDRLAAEWLQRQGILVSVDVAGQAIQTVARDHTFHPVRTYLNNLHWDGIERVDRWLTTYLGADDTEYSRPSAPAGSSRPWPGSFGQEQRPIAA
jgi:putative DNA primase/helicase